MDDKLLVTIYFIGIAAVINVPPHDNVTKAVIFPAASQSVMYNGIALVPHHTWLHVSELENPQEDCARLGGKLSKTNVCMTQLSGARVWVLPTEPLREDAAARKIPSFQKYCPAAHDLPSTYMSDTPNGEYVAARFDIAGGTISACNRKEKAFVMKMDTVTADGMLYVQQDNRTVRVALKNHATVAIENRPDDHRLSLVAGKDHFGWYYFMNGHAEKMYDIKVPVQPVPGVKVCEAIPGADDGMEGSISPDCSISNFP
jgi:hypothetical protein